MENTIYSSHSAQLIRKAMLPHEDPETQLDVMRTWFFENFESPEKRTPYDEGEYIWIWGGPYYPRLELREEFEGSVPDEIIDRLASELEAQDYQWTSAESPDDYDEFLVGDIARITEYYQNFSNALSNNLSLIEIDTENHVKVHLYRLLYASTITAMETYLSDAFINSVFPNGIPNDKLMRRLVESTTNFKIEKIPFSDVYKAYEGVKKKVSSYLIGMNWNSLKRIEPMYKKVLGVSFRVYVEDILEAVQIRNDIVHRNGKSKSGEDIIVNKPILDVLILKVENFVQWIDRDLRDMKDRDWMTDDEIESSPI